MAPRHSLVWLSPKAWDKARRDLPAHHQSRLDFWQHGYWPAIARRADADLPEATICVGVPLPSDLPDGEKIRIALQVSQDDVIRISQPLQIDAVVVAAPSAWQLLEELAAQSKRADIALHVYGSLAMQALTGLPYVTAGSDIDVLFYPTSWTQLQQGLAMLEDFSAGLPLDGEIIFPSGQAVSWKEWGRVAMQPGARVLVKQQQAVSLLAPASLLACFKDAPCVC